MASESALENMEKPEVVVKRQEFYRTVTNSDVFDWPEFQAFAKRLGIADIGDTTRIEIVLDINDMPRVRHEFIGLDPSDRTPPPASNAN